MRRREKEAKQVLKEGCGFVVFCVKIRSTMSSTTTKSGQKVPSRQKHIVTRHRSAQSTRSLRKKEQLTGESKSLLISSNKSQRHQEVRVKKSVQKKVVKKSCAILAENKGKNENKKNNEFYPHKIKRTNFKKRTFLKFKQLQKVLALNKRKLNTPRKELSYISEPDKSNTLCSDIEREPEPTLGITELVRMAEEMEPLSNEDLMEILTCPSPVWWEDPPDGDEYDEEPITHNIAGGKCQTVMINIGKTSQHQKSENHNINVTNDKKNSNKCSLESILNRLKQNTSKTEYSGALRRKTKKCLDNKSVENVDKHIINVVEPSKELSDDSRRKTDESSNDKSMENKDKHILNVDKPSNTSTKIKESVSNNNVDTNKDKDKGKRTDQVNGNIRQRAKSVELNKLYKQLCKENATVNKTFKDCSDKTAKNRHSDISNEIDDDNSLFESDLDDEAILAELDTIIPIEGERKRTNSDCVIIEDTPPIIDITIPEVLPKLVKYPKVTKSPNFAPNFDNDVDVTGRDLDTISDSNVKFLSDDQVSDFDANDEKDDRVEKRSEKDVVKSKPRNRLTVYKITEECLSGVQRSKKLDMVFKQCKNKNRNGKVVDERIVKVATEMKRFNVT